MSLTKSQKQIALLGGILTVIVVLLGIFVFKPESLVVTPYQPKTVDTEIPADVLAHPEYKRLRLPVDLPLEPGRLGRDNPFEPY